MENKQQATPRKKFKMPSAYTILFLIIILVAILTWIIPAGQYSTDKAGNIIAHTYKAVASNPQGIWDVFTAPIYGMIGNDHTEGAISISLFILVIGGFLGVVNQTKALDDGISSVVSKYKGKEKILIPLLMILFALGGSTYGMAEETIAFYPLLIPVMIGVGFDKMVAVAIVLVGSQVGCLASTVNPFATGVASQTLNISPGDGILSRIVLLIITVAISIFYVYRYASKIEKDPAQSIVFDQREDDLKRFALDHKDQSGAKMSGRQKAVLWLFGLTFLLMIIGLIPWDQINAKWTFFASFTKWLQGIPVLGDLIGSNLVPFGSWYFTEITTLFFLMSVIIMFVFKMKESTFVDSFLNGMGEFLGVAIIVAVARGIQVIMNDGNITATVLHWGEMGLSNLGSVVFIILAYIFYIPMSFLIPSTSGLAAATMGIIGPMGKFAGVDPSLVVTAYQSASGWVNLITPTSGVVMGALAIANVNITVWWKFMFKLMIYLFLTSAIFLGIMALL
ncbi:YfcC family protein [Lentilactobacillus hilgardii]|uniref:YfcC family protein n=1 Tax=Lentilactobacillus hilgardii TaxID=1588 RepID=UPI00019C6635|nr:YfcC family protein [Lentilactobacillus hilgardii]EEI19455.1 C4-dicarboxylate anaerobic carrier [Lentilactobacillus buchneri ATCC 11577]MCP9333272.1 YfcC family protein [Lentilactobacillus hilgardii]MCP9349881.1 YfcC family protein [Lentilactobacillus hilgardii]MCP9352809.1 YfcC family protein [Lentilactobacillus hilgardii]MCT3396022.1 YfcC family protein [Lentilactobacillus hilgardii]